MKTIFSFALLISAFPVWAISESPQPPPAPPSGLPVAPAAAAEKQIKPIEPKGKGKKSCEEANKNRKFGVYFDKVDLTNLVQAAADATCKTFIIASSFSGKISILGPENGIAEVSADRFSFYRGPVDGLRGQRASAHYKLAEGQN